MRCEPPQITFIPCEEHFRPVLPTIEGNVDYLSLGGQLTTMNELLRTSGVENEFVVRSLDHWIKTLSESQVEQIELSGEGQRGVIRLKDLVSGKQQQRFQEHSARALRCSIAPHVVSGKLPRFRGGDWLIVRCCNGSARWRSLIESRSRPRAPSNVMRPGCLKKICARSLMCCCAKQEQRWSMANRCLIWRNPWI
jgi:hypothetical protein